MNSNLNELLVLSVEVIAQSCPIAASNDRIKH